MRRHALAVALGLLWALPLGSGAAAAATSSLLASSLHPGVASGDFEFYADAAALTPGDSGRVRTRVLLQFPLRQLLEQTDEDAADLSIRALAYDGEPALAAFAARQQGHEAAPETLSARAEAEHADQSLHDLLADFGAVVPCATAVARARVEAPARQALRETDYQLAEIYLELPPAEYFLEVQVENLSRLKRGLLDKLRRRHRTATARLLVQVPDLQQRPVLADPTFLAGHGKLQQYAARVYGLLNDSLHVRGTLWTDAPARVALVAHDRGGEVHWRDSLQVAAPGQHELLFRTSVNTFPAGQYVLTMTAATDAAQAVARRSFDVAWSLASWKKSQRDLELEAETIFTDEEYRTYETLPLGEKERYLAAFWLRHDPTPETAENELQREFNLRVAYADAHFSESVRGARTHRGKVYIRFGPPNEVQSDAMPGHLAGTGAEDLIAKIEDPYSSAAEEVAGVPSPTESSSFRSNAEQAHLASEAQRAVGPAREMIAYELWIYFGRGSPLLPRDVIGIDAGFRLLFLDTQGFGQFRLRKSSATLDIPGLDPAY